jgi:hypothetical protein
MERQRPGCAFAAPGPPVHGPNRKGASCESSQPTEHEPRRASIGVAFDSARPRARPPSARLRPTSAPAYRAMNGSCPGNAEPLQPLRRRPLRTSATGTLHDFYLLRLCRHPGEAGTSREKISPERPPHGECFRTGLSPGFALEREGAPSPDQSGIPKPSARRSDPRRPSEDCNTLLRHVFPVPRMPRSIAMGRRTATRRVALAIVQTCKYGALRAVCAA